MFKFKFPVKMIVTLPESEDEVDPNFDQYVINFSCSDGTMGVFRVGTIFIERRALDKLVMEQADREGKGGTA